ncbi:MAG: hypothetical protein AAF847_00140 [Bacteroidota bacterium]
MKFRAIHTIYICFILGTILSFFHTIASAVFISIGVLLFAMMSIFGKPTDDKKEEKDPIDHLID